MSDMIQFNNGAVATVSDLTKLGAAAAQASGNDQAMDLLRLLRDGTWVFGADNTEPEESSLWAVNPYSFVHGYISWVDNKPAGEVMVPVTDRLPSRADLPETGGDWSEQMAVQLQCISGEDKGTQVIYKATSKGGKRSIGKLAAAIASQAQQGDEVVPVCELGVDHYQHKQYGRIYTPEFAVKRWVTMEGVGSEVEAEAEAEEAVEEAPKRRRRAA